MVRVFGFMGKLERVLISLFATIVVEIKLNVGNLWIITSWIAFYVPFCILTFLNKRAEKKLIQEIVSENNSKIDRSIKKLNEEIVILEKKVNASKTIDNFIQLLDSCDGDISSIMRNKEILYIRICKDDVRKKNNRISQLMQERICDEESKKSALKDRTKQMRLVIDGLIIISYFCLCVYIYKIIV